MLTNFAEATSVTCDRKLTCPGETVTCTCTTWNSNTLVWTNNGNSLIFTSNDPLMTRRNVDGSSTSAVLTDSSDRNGIRVIMSNITFISAINNVLSCQNVDRSTTRFVIVPISGKSYIFYLFSVTYPVCLQKLVLTLLIK